MMNYNKFDYDKMENTNAIPCEEPVCKETSVKDNLQESRKILHELDAVLNDIAVNVIGIGTAKDIETKAEPDCLRTEAKLITAMSYELLSKARSIRESLL